MFNLSRVAMVCLKLPSSPCCFAYVKFKSKSFGFSKISKYVIFFSSLNAGVINTENSNTKTNFNLNKLNIKKERYVEYLLFSINNFFIKLLFYNAY